MCLGSWKGPQEQVELWLDDRHYRLSLVSRVEMDASSYGVTAPSFDLHSGRGGVWGCKSSGMVYGNTTNLFVAFWMSKYLKSCQLRRPCTEYSEIS